MRPVLAQRLLLLGAVALLGAVGGVAVASRDAQTVEAATRLPRPAVSDLGGWYVARAGVRTRPLAGKPSACGTLLSPKTLGVDHPVLPCGAKVFLRYGRKTVLTAVVDRGPFGPGRQLEVTPALADVLGLSGVQTVRWSFASAG